MRGPDGGAAVFVFGSTLDSRLVGLPRHPWGMPWHPGSTSIEAGLIVTHPLDGWFLRPDGQLGRYAVWHDRLRPQVGDPMPRHDAWPSDGSGTRDTPSGRRSRLIVGTRLVQNLGARRLAGPPLRAGVNADEPVAGPRAWPPLSARPRHAWLLLRSTFWFVPGVMIVLAGVLAGMALTIDSSLVGAPLPDWVYAGGADGARALLSTVAGSMVTVAGLGFSITIVALVLASTQFGPRLLTLFMRDTTSQVTLGTFAGTFTYCVLILRSIRGAGEGGAPFVPQLSVTVAVGLTLLSVAALVYFFHHVAVSIQAPKVVAAVARDLDHAIDHLYPGSLGTGGPEPEPTDIPTAETDAVVPAESSGYVQVVDDALLLELAVGHDLCVRLRCRPGLFVVRGNPILVVRPGVKVDEDLARRLRSTLIIGDARTAEDDIEFSVRQLVEVALRALSPAINDPFTAMAAIDWLGAALARLAREEFPSRYRYDEQGRLRVIADVSTFGGIAHTIFSRIRHYGGTSPVVLNRLLEAVAAFGPHITVESDRQLVRAETESVLQAGRALTTSEADLEELEKRYRAAVSALRGGPS